MTQLNFLYTQEQLLSFANDVLLQAQALGATSAQVELSESISTDVEIRNQHTENFETSQENQLLLTVYCGHKKGNIGISNIRPPELNKFIQQAIDIATYTEEDECNGLLEPQYIVKNIHQDLKLYNEHDISNEALIYQAKELEKLAVSHAPDQLSSDGSSINLTRYNFVTANSNGLLHGYQTSRYSKYVSLIGENEHGMQTDYWYSTSRDFNDLKNNQDLAKTAAARVLRR